MKKKNPIITAIKVIGVALFFSLMLEGLYRFFIFGWDSFSVAKMNSIQGLGTAGLLEAASHPEMIYELKPNLETYFKTVPFETNSHGLRDREYSKAKPANTFRIAVIGDSFTMPSGVTIEDAYHTVLEDRLNREGDGRSYEVLNFGIGGYGMRQYLGAMEHKIRSFDPDLILVAFCAETDHQVTPGRRFRGIYKVKDRSYPFFESFALKVFTDFYGPRHNRGLVTAGLAISSNQREYMAEFFSRMATFSKDSEIPVAVPYLSNRPRNPEIVRDIVTANGLPFVDVSSSFRETNFRDYIIYAIDGHPNAEANKIFADRIYDFLTAERLLIAPGPG